MNLDDLLGPCAPPKDNDIKPQESYLQPRSILQLTAKTSAVVRELLSTPPIPTITSPFLQAYNLLWLIDDSGRLFLSFEELLNSSDELIGVLARSSELRPSTIRKLGHPALLPQGHKDARIGGEIAFDPDFNEDPMINWVLSNKSGRYGLREWQAETHLQAACRLFKDYGIHLSYYFVPPIPS